MAELKPTYGRCPNPACAALLYCDPLLRRFNCPHCDEPVSPETLIPTQSKPVNQEGPAIPRTPDSRDVRNAPQTNSTQTKGGEPLLPPPMGADSASAKQKPSVINASTAAAGGDSVPLESGISVPDLPKTDDRLSTSHSDRRSNGVFLAFKATAALIASALAVLMFQGAAWAFVHLIRQGPLVSYNEPLLIIEPLTLVSLLFLSGWFGGVLVSGSSSAASIWQGTVVGVALTTSLLLTGRNYGLTPLVICLAAIVGSVLAPSLKRAQSLWLGPLRRILSWGAVSKLFAFAAFGAIYFCWKAPSKDWSDILRSSLLLTVFLAIAKATRSVEQTILQRYRDLSATRFLPIAGESGVRTTERTQALGAEPQTARGAAAQSLTDERSPREHSQERFFLYLRPFSVTGRLGAANPEYNSAPMQPRAYSQPRTIDFETRLASLIEPLGPLVALGHPGEQFGAGRILSADEQWKNNFESLATRAKAILLIPSSTPGTLWEIEWLVQRGFVSRCIFVMPPAPAGRLKEMAEFWEDGRTVLSHNGVALPEYSHVGALLLYSGSGARVSSVTLGQTSDKQLRRALATILSDGSITARPRKGKWIKWSLSAVGAIILLPLVVGGLITLTSGPPSVGHSPSIDSSGSDPGLVAGTAAPASLRQRTAFAMNLFVESKGVGGRIRLKPGDDQILEVTGPWVDVKQAVGFIAGVTPTSLREAGFREVRFGKTDSDTVARYDVSTGSW